MTTARILGPAEGKAGILAAIGVRFMIDGDDAGGRFSLVEHPIPPRDWLRRCTGTARRRVQLRAGGEDGRATRRRGGLRRGGDLVFKPRNQWHTFWNAGDEPCRILEIISPAGFEKYFDELVDLAGPRTPETIGPICRRYGLEMRFDSIPELVAEHGLVWPGA